MLLYQADQPLVAGPGLLQQCPGGGVARHGDAELHPLGLDPGEHLLQMIGSCHRLGPPALQTVSEGEQTLAHGVAVAHLAAVHQGDGPHPPAQESPGHGTAQGPGAQQQTPGGHDLVQLELRHQPPLHQLEVQVHAVLGDLDWVHAGSHVCQPRPQLPLVILLPAHHPRHRRGHPPGVTGGGQSEH